ncbi:hypothetical protein D3C72_641150 [compost metagenome]
MQLSHLAVIAVKEGDKVLCQVAFIFFVERADNPAVDADILRIFRVLVTHEDVTWMHISVEETVAEHLGEKYLHPAFSQQFHVGTLLFQRHHIRNGNTVDALHDHHVLTAVVGIDFRYVQHRAVFKVTAQLDGVG